MAAKNMNTVLFFSRENSYKFVWCDTRTCMFCEYCLSGEVVVKTYVDNDLLSLCSMHKQKNDNSYLEKFLIKSSQLTAGTVLPVRSPP